MSHFSVENFVWWQVRYAGNIWGWFWSNEIPLARKRRKLGPSTWSASDPNLSKKPPNTINSAKIRISCFMKYLNSSNWRKFQGLVYHLRLRIQIESFQKLFSYEESAVLKNFMRVFWEKEFHHKSLNIKKSLNIDFKWKLAW